MIPESASRFHGLEEFWDFLVGDEIGSGCYRTVYNLNHDYDHVLKVEKDVRCFTNIREWETWNNAPPAVAKWLAPCYRISDNGRFLLQKRTKPIKFEELPAKCPAFLGDRKTGNFGWYENRVVCHDYGITYPTFPMRMVKGRWYRE